MVRPFIAFFDLAVARLRVFSMISACSFPGDGSRRYRALFDPVHVAALRMNEPRDIPTAMGHERTAKPPSALSPRRLDGSTDCVVEPQEVVASRRLGY
jgi:hypothetical protein